METRNDFTKQYNPSPRVVNYTTGVQEQNYVEHFLYVQPRTYHQLLHQTYCRPNNFNRQCDEPIDLTQNQSKIIKSENDLMLNKEIQAPKSNRGRRSRMIFPPNGSTSTSLTDLNQIQGYFKDVIELQTSESKQVEIMKAAKSLFSKRTRTLYHWMYPSTPKQQIKIAVINLWENLSNAEKQFYISQVLVKFGFPQCNLMVNPQLGGIKELPPLPDTFENNFAAKELQNAISSISDGPSTAFEGKRRQGRPLGSKNKKQKIDSMGYKFSKDFQDDPELSKELEKFAITFDCFK